MAQGGNSSSKGIFFNVTDATVNIPSMKAVCLNRKIGSSDLQQNKTKTGNNRISLKLSQRFHTMQKPLPKRTRWSKMMLPWNSQQRRRVVLRQSRWWKQTGEWLPVCQRWDSATIKRGGTRGTVGEGQRDSCWQPKEGKFHYHSCNPQRLNTGKSLLTWDVQKRNGNGEGGTKKKKGLGRFKSGNHKRR